MRKCFCALLAYIVNSYSIVNSACFLSLHGLMVIDCSNGQFAGGHRPAKMLTVIATSDGVVHRFDLRFVALWHLMLSATPMICLGNFVSRLAFSVSSLLSALHHSKSKEQCIAVIQNNAKQFLIAISVLVTLVRQVTSTAPALNFALHNESDKIRFSCFDYFVFSTSPQQILARFLVTTIRCTMIEVCAGHNKTRN